MEITKLSVIKAVQTIQLKNYLLLESDRQTIPYKIILLCNQGVQHVGNAFSKQYN